MHSVRSELRERFAGDSASSKGAKTLNKIWAIGSLNPVLFESKFRPFIQIVAKVA
jgi:hypothetical protein